MRRWFARHSHDDVLGLDPALFAALAAGVLLGAVVQAVVGLGMGLVFAPIVAALVPELMPVLPLWLGFATASSSLLAERQGIDWHVIRWALPARVAGTVGGIWLVLQFTSSQIGIAVAVMVLLAVALSVRSVTVPINRGTLTGAGLAGGVAGTATSIAGPPIALLLQHRKPSEVRPTLAVFFTVGAAVSLGGLAITGAATPAAFGIGVLLTPFVFAGLYAGAHLRERVSRERFRYGVLVVCALSAIVLLVRSLA